MITYIAGYASKDAMMQCKQDKNGNDRYTTEIVAGSATRMPPVLAGNDLQSDPRWDVGVKQRGGGTK